ncbi:hypothetical protein GT994_09930 [Bifidobacterium longum]|uniref:Uncharacterized protein n=3 Tax=Bifidobacterium longum TaxID=216816 RepID=Q8G6R9_BIFLO|nr:hypothetical protein BL0569 [Bifidobacterium longum NCC2705]KAB6719654.1 hypothetical protein GBL36_10245 [Bifidobacterium longum]MBM5829976.1 hypothetical protein [Bifidobacterium longum subsp. suillum]MZZ95778.1 hypothetical protein [Escherichia coli]THJ30631.1 hypothetical protein E6L38_00885 [Bifidobacterium longum subsp. infantis]
MYSGFPVFGASLNEDSILQKPECTSLNGESLTRRARQALSPFRGADLVSPGGLLPFRGADAEVFTLQNRRNGVGADGFLHAV